jgi:hypothetical protein
MMHIVFQGAGSEAVDDAHARTVVSSWFQDSDKSVAHNLFVREADIVFLAQRFIAGNRSH